MIYAARFNSRAVTFSWTKAGRAQPKPRSPCRAAPCSAPGGKGGGASLLPQNSQGAAPPKVPTRSRGVRASSGSFGFSAPQNGHCCPRVSPLEKGQVPAQHLPDGYGDPLGTPSPASLSAPNFSGTSLVPSPSLAKLRRGYEILPLRAFFPERPQNEEKRAAVGAGRRRARRMRSLEQAAGSAPGCPRKEGRRDGTVGCGGSLIRA